MGGRESPLGSSHLLDDSDFEKNGELCTDDIFSILEAFEFGKTGQGPKKPSPRFKRQKVAGEVDEERVSHITVERNRRKQMNDHLSVLRKLMPYFYVKRGDQASIIGGVVDYIKELQQVLKSLEAKKQRKVYSEVLSPRLIPSPRPSPLSPARKPPPSPTTPTPTSPYMSRLHPTQTHAYLSSPTTMAPTPPLDQCPPNSLAISSINDVVNELVANSKSAIADVEVKFSGANLLLKTISPWIPGQAVKIISALEDLSLEILNVSLNTIEETLLSSFTIKIGIECQLSADELAQQIQQTFSYLN